MERFCPPASFAQLFDMVRKRQRCHQIKRFVDDSPTFVTSFMVKGHQIKTCNGLIFEEPNIGCP